MTAKKVTTATPASKQAIRIQRPQDVRRMLVSIANEVRMSDMELEKKARVLAYLGTVILTAMKDGELEKEVAEIRAEIEAMKKR